MIHPTAVIGDPPEHRDWKHGDPVFPPSIDKTAKVNAYATIDAGISRKTYVGPRAFIMKHVHIGHDAIVMDDCELAPGTVIGGHAILEERVRCGIGVLVKPFVKVGVGARLGMGAVVTKDVPPGEVWVGNPARQLVKAEPEEMTDSEREGWEAWLDNRQTCPWLAP